jgi:homoserine O-acetyltransferase
VEPDPALFSENERTTPRADERRAVHLPDFAFSDGSTMDVTIAYETWGTFRGDNAVLICHALSGDSHAIGWWDRLVGPGKAIDPARWFVIGTNALGGCQGSTGPATVVAGRRLGSRFPAVTVEDIALAMVQAVLEIGVERLALVAGGSMGGMVALEVARRMPTERVWVTASARAHGALQIGFNEAARQAIVRDPKWRGGDYPADDPPRHGLAVARMIGHLSYLSEASFERKFGRRRRESDVFEVESYLNYQGEKFTNRFDAGSLVALTRAIDAYECAELGPARYLFTSFTSDTLYPSHQLEELARMARGQGIDAEWHDIELPFGHDSFLLDGDRQGEIVRRWLGC